MEKRRIRLEINGVVCGLITQESEEYMNALAGEVGEMMKAVLDASPFVTREAAALTAALSYCDDAKKNGQKAKDLQERVDELEVEAEIWQEEKAQLQTPKETPPDPALLKRLEELQMRTEGLEQRNTALEEAAGETARWRQEALRLEDENEALRAELRAGPASKTEPPKRAEPAEAAVPVPGGEAPEGKPARRKNPLRYDEEYEQEGFVSFFEKK